MQQRTGNIIAMKKILCLVCLLAVAVAGSGQQIIKETYLYGVKDSDSLYLDKYTSRALQQGGPSPCFIFMFGGGFFTGQRDGVGYIPYFEFLVRNGYTVVSIDYRLGLKPIATGEVQVSSGRKGLIGKIRTAKSFVGIFQNTIEIAVEDLFDATAFVLDHVQKWGIDPARIIANGSSAGAITVLQGEYSICNGLEVAARLPAGFNYAGVVSFAGAVFADSRDIAFNTVPCPMMLFHGDADSNVPYDKIRKFGMGFFGSKHIAAKLIAIKAPHVFYSVENADHRIAASPMTDNREDILSFLEKFVHGGERLIIDTDVDQLDVAGCKKKFKIADYIRSNFGGGQ